MTAGKNTTLESITAHGIEVGLDESGELATAAGLQTSRIFTESLKGMSAASSKLEAELQEVTPMSPLLAEMLSWPFPCLLYVPKQPRSEDSFDARSTNYLRPNQMWADRFGAKSRASSVGELELVWRQEEP